MRNFIAFMIVIVSFLVALYIGVWVMFIHPIIALCLAFDAHTITAFLVGTSILKICLAGFVGWVIALTGCSITTYIKENK